MQWLIELLVAAYSGAVIPSIVVSAWYQFAPDSAADPSKNILLTQAAGDQKTKFPIIGGGVFYEKDTQTVLAAPRRSLILQDQHSFMVQFSGATVNGRGYSIRGIAWESPDIEELLCVARGIH